MTQKELAKHLQIADSTLSYWEMGKYEPDINALRKLSEFFQVPIDYILGGDFATWNLSGTRASSSGANASNVSGFDINVSEPDTAYSLNNKKNSKLIESTVVDKPSNVSAETSIADTTNTIATAITTFSNRNALEAFNRTEFEDLTIKEIDSLAEYALFIKSRRKI
jgi:transcriptional regulator with XRE-family HTH domain